MKNKFVEWSKEKYSERQRIIALLLLAPIFLVIIPLTFLFVSNFDRSLGLSKFYYGIFSSTIAILLIITGFIFAIWSIKAQLEIGKGTPVPIMPTQKLVIVKPFLYCRNPMTFGTILLYLGVVVSIGSLSSLVLLILMTVALITYIKLIEEKELELRFGKEYLEYKKRTPFLIPQKGNRFF